LATTVDFLQVNYNCGRSLAASMAAKLLKLELIYDCMGKKLMGRTLFFAIALAAVSILYTVHDVALCAYISDCLDDFMVDFDSPRLSLIRRNSL